MVDIPIADVLTDQERLVLKLLSEAAGLMRKITLTSDYTHDWVEAAAAIHVLQRMVISQLGHRLFPDEFRPLGGQR